LGDDSAGDERDGHEGDDDQERLLDDAVDVAEGEDEGDGGWATVQRTGDPPKTRERPSPEPTALPTENISVMPKTPTPASTPTGLPRCSLIEVIREVGVAMPSRTLMSVKKIMRMVETAMTHTRV
jgi:hypothetical protein